MRGSDALAGTRSSCTCPHRSPPGTCVLLIERVAGTAAPRFGPEPDAELSGLARASMSAARIAASGQRQATPAALRSQPADCAALLDSSAAFGWPAAPYR